MAYFDSLVLTMASKHNSLRFIVFGS